MTTSLSSLVGLLVCNCIWNLFGIYPFATQSCLSNTDMKLIQFSEVRRAPSLFHLVIYTFAAVCGYGVWGGLWAAGEIRFGSSRQGQRTFSWDANSGLHSVGLCSTHPHLHSPSPPPPPPRFKHPTGSSLHLRYSVSSFCVAPLLCPHVLSDFVSCPQMSPM